MSGLSTATSGLRAAQMNLYVTGHNLANAKAPGFTRQSVLQHDFRSRNIGNSANGVLQVGMGTDISSIRQIRDRFWDVRFRETVPRVHYLEVRSGAGQELLSIFGELEGQYRLQSVLQDFSRALHELNKEPNSLEARANFINFAGSFVDKVNNASRSMREYQEELNDQVIRDVRRVNQLLSEISDLNRRIRQSELGGANANDFRDARNNAIDELAGIINIEVTEGPNGAFTIFSGGHLMMDGGFINWLGLRYSGHNTHFVEPVFSNSDQTLEFDPTGRNAISFFNYARLGASYTDRQGAGRGSLLGLIAARGLTPADYTSYPPMTRTEVMAEFEAIFNPVAALTAAGAPFSGFANAGWLANFRDFMENPENHLVGTPPTLVMPLPPALAPGTFPDLYDPAVVAALPAAVTPEHLAQLKTFIAAMENPRQALHNISGEYFMADRNLFNMNVAQVPRVQAELDTLVNSIVEMFNNAFSPLDAWGNLAADAPFGLGSPPNQPQHIPLFVRRAGNFSNADGTRNATIQSRFLNNSLYTTENIIINPVLQRQGGHSLLSLSPTGDESDNTLISSIIQQWSTAFISFGDSNPRSIDLFYRAIVDGMAVETSNFESDFHGAVEETLAIENQRASISGVSIEEEMSNMIRFQHAYNAAARVLNTLDSMIDRIINGTGRVGL
ncbi:MAG: flagellar hook-associated protein FlgK [Defluviitaleaceae bacterium]|nr:flagellar hook-associated protein FlgK [Defluviitaleaceae bacterium]